MKNEKLLSIDLGTAYTKVAVRRGWDHAAEVLTADPRASDEDRFCVPSVVACANRNGAEKWLFFGEAADTAPGASTRVYRYWKPQLFEGPEASQEALGIAIRYLTALRQLVAGIDRRLVNYPVRLCVPKIGHSDTIHQIASTVLLESGWSAATGDCYAYEPTANACGLLTRGRNLSWTPPPIDFQPHRGRQRDLSGMLDRHGLMRWLQSMHEQYRVLVLDIGAFTTDFGLVEFNTRFDREKWQFDRVAQESVRIGIRDLDKLLWERLPEEQREAIKRATTRQWEDRKRRVYSGQAAAFRHPNGGIIEIGGAADRELIESAIGDFSTEVIQALERFRAANSQGRLHAYMVTGGGLNIRLVREAIVTALSSRRTGRFFDLRAEEEPEQAGLTLPREIEKRRRENQILVRGASAIGGASLFFE
jgi:hypothetical protein